MKMLIMMVVSAVLLTSVAAGKKPKTPEQLAKMKQQQEAFFRATGGILYDKKSGVGSVAVIDSQREVQADFIKQHIVKIEQMSGLPFKYFACSNSVDFSNLDGVLKSSNGSASIVLIDNQAIPSAIVSLPEKKCVLMNLASLKKDGLKEDVLKSRVAKELSRSVCFVFVIPYCNAPGGVMDPISDVEALDKILVDNIQVAQKPHIERSAERHFGMKTYRRATYRDACQQGWAPKPRNKYQEAIWKEVHELPTSPITIEKK